MYILKYNYIYLLLSHKILIFWQMKYPKSTRNIITKMFLNLLEENAQLNYSYGIFVCLCFCMCLYKTDSFLSQNNVWNAFQCFFIDFFFLDFVLIIILKRLFIFHLSSWLNIDRKYCDNLRLINIRDTQENSYTKEKSPQFMLKL